jgi:hypothetical protein
MRLMMDTFALPLVLGKDLIGVADVLTPLFRDVVILALALLGGGVPLVVKDLVGAVHYFSAEHVAGTSDALEAGFNVIGNMRHDE